MGMQIIADSGDILFATENGYGKKVAVHDFRVAHRGGLGVRTIPTTGRNGNVIGLVIVRENSDVLLIDKAGKIIRLPATEIRTMGRQAKGVRLIRLDAGQQLASIVSFDQREEVSDNDDEPPLISAHVAQVIKAAGVSLDAIAEKVDTVASEEESEQQDFDVEPEDDFEEDDTFIMF